MKRYGMFMRAKKLTTSLLHLAHGTIKNRKGNKKITKNRKYLCACNVWLADLRLVALNRLAFLCMYKYCYTSLFVCDCKVWRRKARKLAKKGSSVTNADRMKDGVPLRGRPPGLHTGTRGRPPLHAVKFPASTVDDANALHYKVGFLLQRLQSNRLRQNYCMMFVWRSHTQTTI